MNTNTNTLSTLTYEELELITGGSKLSNFFGFIYESGVMLIEAIAENLNDPNSALNQTITPGPL